MMLQCLVRFQSTLPVRGATLVCVISGLRIRFQSTLPVRGATREYRTRLPSFQFQSTLPVRGATLKIKPRGFVLVISIHAPRAGSDDALDAPLDRTRYFNPRSPCGERPMSRMRQPRRL